MLGSIALEIAENVVISVVSYNAYVDCDLINDDDGNPDEIVLKAGYNTVGLVEDGHVDYVLDGKQKDPLQDFRAGRRKAIPHTNPDDPALSEGYNTSTGYDDSDTPKTVVLTATHDATCFAYVDGNLTSGATPVGRIHQIDWDASKKKFTCFVDTRSSTPPHDWVRDNNPNNCMPTT